MREISEAEALLEQKRELDPVVSYFEQLLMYRIRGASRYRRRMLFRYFVYRVCDSLGYSVAEIAEIFDASTASVIYGLRQYLGALEQLVPQAAGAYIKDPIFSGTTEQEKLRAQLFAAAAEELDRRRRSQYHS